MLSLRDVTAGDGVAYKKSPRNNSQRKTNRRGGPNAMSKSSKLCLLGWEILHCLFYKVLLDITAKLSYNWIYSMYTKPNHFFRGLPMMHCFSEPKVVELLLLRGGGPCPIYLTSFCRADCLMDELGLRSKWNGLLGGPSGSDPNVQLTSNKKKVLQQTIPDTPIIR